jgi:hypothetical protein
MRMLAYGVSGDTKYKYRVSDSTIQKSMYRFCRAVIRKFGPHYLRGPNEEVATCIMA